MEKRPDLADLYAAALGLLHEPAQEIGARTRVAYICHSMREVMNRVLGAMGHDSAPRVRPASEKLVQQLPNLLARFPGLELDSEGELVQIPQAVAGALDQLIKTSVQEQRRSRDDVASLLTDDGNADHVAVTRWIKSRGFFVKWAHLHDSDVLEDALPSDDEIRVHIDVFESLFDGVITAFFASRHSVDALLAELNTIMEDENG